MTEVCWGCICGLHLECVLSETEDCCCETQVIDLDEGVEREVNPVGRPMLEPDQITDVVSTGRKRAAMLAPIFPGMLCEWAGLRYAGGGIEPIIGCDGNIIQPSKGKDKGDRHHGPDKNVLNNAVGVNLHRICSPCHNRYHAKNNRYYSGPRPPASQPWLPDPEYGECRPHDPVTRATPEEIEANEEFWGSNAKTLLRGVDTSD